MELHLFGHPLEQGRFAQYDVFLEWRYRHCASERGRRTIEDYVAVPLSLFLDISDRA